MESRGGVERLVAMEARFAILGVGRYALPVGFRVRGSVVECRVPTWSGVGDLLIGQQDVTLVAVSENGPHLHWLFIRGSATVVPEPDWTGMDLPGVDRSSPDDLYQLLRVAPRRIEEIDEARGWGSRETVDL